MTLYVRDNLRKILPEVQRLTFQLALHGRPSSKQWVQAKRVLHPSILSQDIMTPFALIS